MAVRITLCFHHVFLLRISSGLTITQAYNATLALWAQEMLRRTSRREEAQASMVTWPSPPGEAVAEGGLTPLLHAWSVPLLRRVCCALSKCHM